ncbi:hypothetical protein SAMN05428987_1688 [Paenibacillus sp. CF095]|uniref:hypothetical protein n=1 Tax=Paenibacillus sp. CF095 TaxID=1881033 RepID=UPI000887248F|nr:hypothetical protein [Paenibacillus sp. CF095]SDC53723.1 hypothetical protein SAMN05428987_1688 [Paenibacillus sp. CF095]
MSSRSTRLNPAYPGRSLSSRVQLSPTRSNCPVVLSLADSLQLPLAGFNFVFLVSLMGNYSLTLEELLKQNMIEAKLGMWTGSYTSSSVTSLFFWFPSEPALDLEKLRLSLPFNHSLEEAV